MITHPMLGKYVVLILTWSHIKILRTFWENNFDLNISPALSHRPSIDCTDIWKSGGINVFLEVHINYFEMKAKFLLSKMEHFVNCVNISSFHFYSNFKNFLMHNISHIFTKERFVNAKKVRRILIMTGK